MARTKTLNRLAASTEAPAPQTLPETTQTLPVLIPLSDLYLSPLNPRQEHDPEGVHALAQSILALGLMQNLAGLRDPDGRVGIVAGGRRLAALTVAAETNPDLGLVPVRLAPDEATARLWAVAENTARVGLHIVDEVRAYRRMAETGSAVTVIASAFAVTEAHVRRRLKLAHLPDPILDALKAGQIGAGHAQVLTLCEDEARQLAALEQVRLRRLDEFGLRRVLLAERVPSTDRRAVFVGLDAYTEAGGQITRDLFSEDDDRFLDDAALLDALFVTKLREAAETMRAEGWRWAETIEEPYMGWALSTGMHRLYLQLQPLAHDLEAEIEELSELTETEALSEEQEERLAALESQRVEAWDESDKAVSGGWLYVDRDGQLMASMGFVRPEDRADAIEAGCVPPDLEGHEAERRFESAAPKAGPYSAAVSQDMDKVRLAAVQGALLNHPELVLDLLAYALTEGRGYGASALGVRVEPASVVPSIVDGFEPDARLMQERDPWQSPQDALAAFTTQRAAGGDHRTRLIVEALTRGLHLHRGNSPYRALFETIERETGASVRAVWRPTAANLFARMTSAALDDLFRDVLDRPAEDGGFREFSRLKKAEKATAMEAIFNDPNQRTWIVTPDQRARLDAWVPPCVA